MRQCQNEGVNEQKKEGMKKQILKRAKEQKNAWMKEVEKKVKSLRMKM